jgi:TRAP-type C4-dicarboxylate transport system permease small subunit
MMKRALTDVSNLFSTGMEIIAGVALVAVMLLTGCDIVGRAFGHPIPGTYEIVSFAGGLVIGMAMPVTSRARAHVIVDLVTAHVSERAGSVLHVITRVMGIALFLLMGYAIIKMAGQLRASGEVTPVLSLPFYLVAYAIAGACFIESLILTGDITRGGGGAHE